MSKKNTKPEISNCDYLVGDGWVEYQNKVRKDDRCFCKSFKRKAPFLGSIEIEISVNKYNGIISGFKIDGCIEVTKCSLPKNRMEAINLTQKQIDSGNWLCFFEN